MDEFWYEDVNIVSMRCRAYEKRMDKEAWLNGRYIQLALTSVASSLLKDKKDKPFEYPDKPFTMQTEEIKHKSQLASQRDMEKEYREITESFI